MTPASVAVLARAWFAYSHKNELLVPEPILKFISIYEPCPGLLVSKVQSRCVVASVVCGR